MLILAHVLWCLPSLEEEEAQRSEPSGFPKAWATWKGCRMGVSTWVLTWLRGGGSEFSRASSCWSLACAEPTSCWSSKNSGYWSWNTAA